uniref:Uncharacterized protein n=1 Tax=Candidatus Kentrum sp. LPFa TaxID=2126335 RepID=A0A450WE46_9GAMM|nr:MAG: hypothetical protein BECKLPF1236B_GA0070989_10758 [Candidatus Kentron sp. LPFa]
MLFLRELYCKSLDCAFQQSSINYRSWKRKSGVYCVNEPIFNAYILFHLPYDFFCGYITFGKNVAQ